MSVFSAVPVTRVPEATGQSQVVFDVLAASPVGCGDAPYIEIYSDVRYRASTRGRHDPRYSWYTAGAAAVVFMIGGALLKCVPSIVMLPGL